MADLEEYVPAICSIEDTSSTDSAGISATQFPISKLDLHTRRREVTSWALQFKTFQNLI